MRSSFAASLLLMITAGGLAAQESLYRHHEAFRPDYLGDLMPAAPVAIPMPPPPPAVVRGLYLNRWVFGGERLLGLIRLADTTEVNAFVIDVKDATGELTYPSSVPTAIQIGANRAVSVRDVRGRLALLHERGIHTIARIVIARDPLLARGKRDWAIHDQSGGLWYDGLGEPWVDAYHDSVWIYAAQLAQEAVLLGFEEIQYDYVRFPDEPPARLGRTVYPARRPGDSKRDAVQRNVQLLAERVKALGVPYTLDVFGLTTSAVGDLGIGQVWEDLVSAADVVLPMVYPSHYRRGTYGIPHPNAEPYVTVRRALEEGIERSRGIPSAARIRPYLQSFSIFGVRYSAAEVRAQIRAVEDLGLTDWILWNSSGRYPAAAFRRSEPAAAASPDLVQPS